MFSIFAIGFLDPWLCLGQILVSLFAAYFIIIRFITLSLGTCSGLFVDCTFRCRCAALFTLRKRSFFECMGGRESDFEIRDRLYKYDKRNRVKENCTRCGQIAKMLRDKSLTSTNQNRATIRSPVLSSKLSPQTEP